MFLRILCGFIIMIIIAGCDSKDESINAASNFDIVQNVSTNSYIWTIDWRDTRNFIAVGQHHATQVYYLDSDEMRLLQNEPGLPNSVMWGGDNDSLLAGTSNIVWVREGNTITNISGSPADYRYYRQVVWNHDSSLLSALYVSPRPAPNQLRIWNFLDGSLQQNIESVSHYSWGQDNMLTFSLQNSPSVYLLIDYQNLESIELFNFEENVNSLSWNPLNTQLASTSVGGRLAVWDFATEEMIFEGENLPMNIFSIKWSPSGDLISIASEESTIVVCLTTGSRTTVHESRSQDTTWHSEQAMLATAQDENLVIYDVSQIIDDCE